MDPARLHRPILNVSERTDDDPELKTGHRGQSLSLSSECWVVVQFEFPQGSDGKRRGVDFRHDKEARSENRRESFCRWPEWGIHSDYRR
jgi:hypothetical protein